MTPAKLIVALAIVLSATSATLAQSLKDNGTAARDAAIHECSVKVAKYHFNTWQTTQFAVYGTCMAEHGQPS